MPKSQRHLTPTSTLEILYGLAYEVRGGPVSFPESRINVCELHNVHFEFILCELRVHVFFLPSRLPVAEDLDVVAHVLVPWRAAKLLRQLDTVSHVD